MVKWCLAGGGGGGGEGVNASKLSTVTGTTCILEVTFRKYI